MKTEFDFRVENLDITKYRKDLFYCAVTSIIEQKTLYKNSYFVEKQFEKHKANYSLYYQGKINDGHLQRICCTYTTEIRAFWLQLSDIEDEKIKKQFKFTNHIILPFNARLFICKNMFAEFEIHSCIQPYGIEYYLNRYEQLRHGYLYSANPDLEWTEIAYKSIRNILKRFKKRETP